MDDKVTVTPKLSERDKTKFEGALLGRMHTLKEFISRDKPQSFTEMNKFDGAKKASEEEMKFLLGLLDLLKTMR